MNDNDLDEYMKLKQEISNDLMARLHPSLQSLLEEVSELRKEVAPMIKIFGNVNGFDKVIKWVLIRLGLLGAGLGGLYLVIEEVKRFIKTH